MLTAASPVLGDLFARFASVPSLVAPDMRDRFEACLRSAALCEAKVFEADAATDSFWEGDPSDWRSMMRPYVVKDGVLQIPVKGVLLHDFSYALGSWATGYIYIQKAFERGMADGMVKGIALVIDSPGGQVAGCFEAVDKMRAISRTKPVRAFAHESAYSAAYAIATVADKRIVSRTGGVGSIGCVTTHVDYSKNLEQAGIKITFIAESEGKTDGNPYEPLGKNAEARIRARISEIYDLFVATVARNVGMDEKKVRDLKSFTYSAKEGVQNGLADEIGPLDDAVAAFVAELDPEQGDPTMTKEISAVDQAALDTAHAAGVAEGKAAGLAEGETIGLAKGATAARERISAIVASDEGKKRPATAMSIAMDTEMTVEQSAVFLAKLPEEVKKTFSDAMDESGNPNLGGGEGDGGEPKDEIRAAIDAFAVPGFKRKAK